MSTVHLILLYAVEIWTESLKIKNYCHVIMTVQRLSTLSIDCSYWTASAQAVLMVKGVIPIDLLAFDRQRINEKSADRRRQDAASTERRTTITAWQQRWTEEITGNLTRRLIKDLRP